MEYTSAVIKMINQIYCSCNGWYRLCKTLIEVQDIKKFHSIILPKNYFRIIEYWNDNKNLKIISTKSKIKFVIDNIILISKVIDGNFQITKK